MRVGFSGSSVVRNTPANRGDSDSIPGSGRSPGEGNSNPLQYSCLKNPMDREAWQATVHRVAKVSDTTWWLNNNNSMREDSTQLFTGDDSHSAHWPTVRCVFYSPCRKRQKTASVSRISPLSGEAMKTGSKRQGHLVTSSSHLCFMVQFKEDEWFTLGSRPTNRPWRKSFSHPRLTHTHTLQFSFLPSSPPNKILLLEEAAGSFIAVSGLQEPNSKKWMFCSENWHWTEGRKWLLQFKHVLLAEVGTQEAQNWLRNQWESHKFCLLSQQLRFSFYSATHFFFSLKGFG